MGNWKAALNFFYETYTFCNISLGENSKNPYRTTVDVSYIPAYTLLFLILPW